MWCAVMTITLTGTVERLVFTAPDEGFAVARFKLDGIEDQPTYDQLTTIVGDLGRVSPGETLRVGGEWETHPRHGHHFRVQWVEQKLPTTVEGIRRFLGSGIIRGIGHKTAEQVVSFLGERTIEIIENHPEQLNQIPKLTRKRAELIVRGWREHHHSRDLMLFLQSHNLPASLAKRLRDEYGDQSVSIIQRNPYQLGQEVYGIGFKTSDAIAVKLGLSRFSTERFVAGISHVLDEATREGHVFLPRSLLLKRASKLMDATSEQIEPALLEALRQGIATEDGDSVYAPPFFYAERNAANRLHHIQYGASFINDHASLNVEAAVNQAIATLGIHLAGRQIEAVRMSLRDKVSIITGGPGTGKTMCLHAVITALDAEGIPFSLCAPTGRAAKRMAATTGRPASTIHRLLGFQPKTNGFVYNSDNQLDPAVFIVDEVSMVDIALFNHLLKAMPDEAHVVLVGDSDQLPAVGPGNVLADLLGSETVPSVMLDQLFRQSKDSQITTAAHRIRTGGVPRPEGQNDLYLVRVSDPAAAQRMIEELVSKRIPDRFHLDPKLDIQVLSPMHRGPAGVAALNGELQKLLNPTGGGHAFEGSGLRLGRGDKVMQIRNDYEKEVFNGDVGLVLGIDEGNRVLTVRFEEGSEFRDVDYDFADMNELALAYAVSIHKAQGSEFPCVVFPLLTSHYNLLQRNLVYTALTRAKQLCVIVHQPQALATAVTSQRRDRRYTGLAERLKTLRFEPALEMSMEPF